MSPVFSTLSRIKLLYLHSSPFRLSLIKNRACTKFLFPFDKFLQQITATIFPLKVQRSGEFRTQNSFVIINFSFSCAKGSRTHQRFLRRFAKLGRELHGPPLILCVSHAREYNTVLYHFDGQFSPIRTHLITARSITRFHPRYFSDTLYAINRVTPENTVARSITRTPSDERLDRKCCWQRSRETHRARLQRGDSGLIGTLFEIAWRMRVRWGISNGRHIRKLVPANAIVNSRQNRLITLGYIRVYADV